MIESYSVSCSESARTCIARVTQFLSIAVVFQTNEHSYSLHICMAIAVAPQQPMIQLRRLVETLERVKLCRADELIESEHHDSRRSLFAQLIWAHAARGRSKRICARNIGSCTNANANHDQDTVTSDYLFAHGAFDEKAMPTKPPTLKSRQQRNPIRRSRAIVAVNTEPGKAATRCSGHVSRAE